MGVETVAALHWNIGRRRFGRGRRYSGTRRCDAPFQNIFSEAGWPDWWQDLAHDKQAWRELEAGFVAMITEVKRQQPLPAVRH